MKYLIAILFILFIFSSPAFAKEGSSFFEPMKQFFKMFEKGADNVKDMSEDFAKQAEDKVQEKALEVQEEVKQEVKQEIKEQAQKKSQTLANRIKTWLSPLKNKVQQGSDYLRGQLFKVKDWVRGLIY